MLYQKLGNLELPASVVGMGCWNIGNQWGEMTDEEAVAIVKCGIAAGMTVFDVAESYGIPHGMSEIRLGKAIKEDRDKLILISKVGHWGARTGQKVPITTPDMVRLCVHSSLGRLQTDRIEVMLAHEENLPAEQYKVFVEGFRELIKEGYIKEYGVSTSDLEGLKTFYEVSDGEMTVVETDYSLLNDAAETNGFMDFCKEHDITVLCRGPLRQGLLSGRYDRNTVFTDAVRTPFNEGGKRHEEFLTMMDRLDALKPKVAAVPDMDLPTYAIRYLFSQSPRVFVIPGATGEKQILANVKAGERTLTKEELAFVK